MLNNALSVPEPKKGLTMHNDDVLGEMAEVGMRLLYAPSFSSALINPCW